MAALYIYQVVGTQSELNTTINYVNQEGQHVELQLIELEVGCRIIQEVCITKYEPQHGDYHKDLVACKVVPDNKQVNEHIKYLESYADEKDFPEPGLS